MKAVILAAGVGSRLGRPFPKSLSRLPGGGKLSWEDRLGYCVKTG